MHRIAIFASGEGTNTQNFIDYFKNSKDITISLIVCNKREAGVVSRALEAGIPFLIVDKDTFYNANTVLEELKKRPTLLCWQAFYGWSPILSAKPLQEKW